MCRACDMASMANQSTLGGMPDAAGGEGFATRDGQGYNGLGGNSPVWWPSRYGPDDRIGAGNELTAERTLQAIRLVREGRIIELSQVMHNDMPIWSGSNGGWENSRPLHQSIAAHGQLEAFAPSGNQIGYLEENVFKTYHVGTHIDALAHIGIGGRYYNGLHYKEFYTPTGCKELGVENIRPWVSRGVLLNIAGLLGVDIMEEGFVITPEHLEEASRRQNVEVRAGDAVILHTGYGALWMVDNDRYSNHEPGIGWAAAHWLTDRRVSLIGADTWSVEVLPSENRDTPFVVHQHLLTETGTHILENVKTPELVESGASEFLFICLPIKHRGATGSQVSPVAVL